MQNESLLNHDVEPDTPSPVVLTGDFEGIQVDQLKDEDVLEVRTKNTLYTLKVLFSDRRVATATSDGRFITEETEVVILGSPLESEFRFGEILCQHSLRLSLPNGPLTTSSVRSIRITRTDGEVIDLGEAQ